MGMSVREYGERARWLVLEKRLPVALAITETLDAASNGSAIEDESTIAAALADRLSGFGVLQPFLDDPEIEEFWINRPNELFVHRAGSTQRITLDLDLEHIESILERMLRLAGRRLDRTSPFVDAKLPDGSRLHAAIPDITRDNISINVRRFRSVGLPLSELVTSEHYTAILKALAERRTILISGATASGKTTLLGALLDELPHNDRIVSAEDTFELNLANPDWVAMQTRLDSAEGSGEIDLRRLIRESLRMRPGWLVVGEVRGAEAVELLVALNSGIPALCTIHANSGLEALDKLATLPLLASTSIPLEFAKQLFSRAIGLVVHLGIDDRGRRSVIELVEPS